MNPVLCGLLCLGLVTAPRTDLSGYLVLSYGDIATHGGLSIAASNHGQFSFDLIGLNLAHRFNDRADAYASLINTGSTMTANEAWFRMDGLPLEGSVTAGRFYKPLGAPIPTPNLSFPSILFHVYTDVGVKFNFQPNIWSLELGVVNGAPVTGAQARAAQVGGSQVVSNVTSTPFVEAGNDKDAYGRLGIALGEDWGSLTAGVGGTIGRLTAEEVGTLNPTAPAPGPPPPPPPTPSAIGQYTSVVTDDKRSHFNADLDYAYGPFGIMGEYYYARDGRLRRRTWSVAASWKFYTAAGEVTATAGYDEYEINAERVVSGISGTWNRRRRSLSLSWWPSERLQLSAEYDFNEENARLANGGEIMNDEAQVQCIAYF